MQVKIPVVPFSRSFVQVARQVAPQVTLPESCISDAVGASTPQATGMLGTLRGLFSLGKPKAPSPEQMESQAKLTLHTACQALGPSLAAVVAQKVGLELFTPAQEAEIAAGHLSNEPKKAGFEKDWQTVSKYASRAVECKTVESGKFGPAMFVGQTVFLNESELKPMPAEVRIFLIGHELGHIEHRDSAAKIGMGTLAIFEPGLELDPNAVSKEMEYAADRRAAEIAAREGCRPHEILRTLLSWPGGGTHPEALPRAEAVRKTMGQHGVEISDSDYQALVDQTEPIRQAARKAQAADLELLQAFQELV